MSPLPELLQLTRASGCVECGKCSAACSMPAMYADFSLRFSPRGLVQQVLRSGGPDNPTDIWRCLGCGNCSAVCPEGVDVALLIRTLREQAGAEAKSAHMRCCALCARELPAAPAGAWLQSVLAEHEQNDAPEETATPPFYAALCPVCRRQAYAYNNSAG